MTLRGGGSVLALALTVVACGPESKESGSSGAGGGAGQGGGNGASAGQSGGSAGHGGSAGGAGLVDTGSGPEGPWPCTASVEITLPAVPVRGTVAGSALAGTLCAGGLAASASDFTNPDTGELLTALVFIGPGGTSPRFQWDTPAGTGEANLEGRVGIGSGNPQPGTFTNESCGAFLLVADIPPAGADSVALYSAAADSNCERTTLSSPGDWTLELTSITPVPEDGAATAYIPHGTLSAVFENAADSGDIVHVELEF